MFRSSGTQYYWGTREPGITLTLHTGLTYGGPTDRRTIKLLPALSLHGGFFLHLCKVLFNFAVENLSGACGLSTTSANCSPQASATEYYFNRPFVHIKRNFDTHNMERFRGYFNRLYRLAASPFSALTPCRCSGRGF